MNVEEQAQISQPIVLLYERLMDCLIPAFPIKSDSGKAFFAYAHQKNAVVNEKLVCPLVDPLIESLDNDHYTNVVFGKVEKPELIVSQHMPHQLNIQEFLLSLFFLPKTSISDLKFLWSLQRPMPRLAFHWTFFAIRTLLIANYIALKMRRVAQKADCAYVVVYYNATMLGVVSAFRRLGKEAWDVQHGLIGPTHTAYNNPQAFAIKSSLQPTGFLVWDKAFGKYLANTLSAKWRSTDYLHLKAFQQKGDREAGSQTILYSLQWGTPVPIEVRNAIAQLPDIHWIFRKHPFEKTPRTDLKWINDFDNAEIKDSSLPLADALLRSHLHITYNSSVVFEAAALKIPSVLITATGTQAFPPQAHDAFKEVIRDGHAVIVSAEKLVAMISQFLP